jgi:hypothetical protein
MRQPERRGHGGGHCFLRGTVAPFHELPFLCTCPSARWSLFHSHIVRLCKSVEGIRCEVPEEVIVQVKKHPRGPMFMIWAAAISESTLTLDKSVLHRVTAVLSLLLLPPLLRMPVTPTPANLLRASLEKHNETFENLLKLIPAQYYIEMGSVGARCWIGMLLQYWCIGRNPGEHDLVPNCFCKRSSTVCLPLLERRSGVDWRDYAVRAP